MPGKKKSGFLRDRFRVTLTFRVKRELQDNAPSIVLHVQAGTHAGAMVAALDSDEAGKLLDNGYDFFSAKAEYEG